MRHVNGSIGRSSLRSAAIALGVLTTSVALVATSAEIASATPRTAAPAGVQPASFTTAPVARRSAQRRTYVRGWRTNRVTVTPGQVARFRLRVRTVQHHKRPVRLVVRNARSHRWVLARYARTTKAGRVTLAWRVPRHQGTYLAQVRVPRVRGARATATRPRVIVVRPRATPVASPASAEDARMLELLNQTRAQGRSCGGQYYGAVGPLSLNNPLGRAASKYALRMATENFFAHNSPQGDGPSTRAAWAGYKGSTVGENIAAGMPFDSPYDVLQGWLASPPHCAGIMTGRYHVVGVGHAYRVNSSYKHYWVLDFGG